MIVIAARPLLQAPVLRQLGASLATVLGETTLVLLPVLLLLALRIGLRPHFPETHALLDDWYLHRSEERRVGKECVSTCRSRWSPDHNKKTNQSNILINT